jgi:hypothetical protein
VRLFGPPLLAGWRGEAKFALVHIDAGPFEKDAFQLQKCALMEAFFSGEPDLSAMTQNAMPGQSSRAYIAKRPCDLASPIRVSGGSRHARIRSDFTAGYLPDDALNIFKTAHAHPQMLPM